MSTINRYKIGELQVDLDLYSVIRNDGNIKLEPKAALVLKVLINSPKQLVTRDDLIRCVWNNRMVTDEAINRVIARLRKALGDNAQSPQYIETIPKKGYRLIASVEPFEQSSIALEKNKWRYISVSIASVILVLIAWQFILNNGDNVRTVTFIGPQVKPLTVLKGNERQPDFSKDGQLLVFTHKTDASEPWQITVQELDTQKTLSLDDEQHTHGKPHWAATSDQLIFHRWSKGYCGVHVVDFDRQNFTFNRSRELIRCNDASSFIGLAWGHKGKKIYYTDGINDHSPLALWSMDIESGKRQQLTNPKKGRGDYDIALSNDGKRVGVIRTSDWFTSELLVFDIDNQHLQSVTQLSRIVFGLSWSADDQALVVGGHDGSLSRIDIDSGQQTLIYQSNDILDFPTINHATGEIAITEGLHYSEQIWVSELEPSNPYRNYPLITSSRRDWAPEFANRSKRLAFVSDRTGSEQIWIREPENNYRRITNFNRPLSLNYLRWSPDDTAIACAFDGQLWIIDVESGVTKQLDVGDLYALLPNWSSDGESIYFTVQENQEYSVSSLQLNSGKLSKIIAADAYVVQLSNNQNIIYFSRYKGDGVWQKHLVTGQEQLILPGLKPKHWNDWRAVNNLIYFNEIDEIGNDLMVFDITTQHTEKVLDRDKNAFSFSVSYDNTMIAMDQLQHKESGLILLMP